MVQHLFFLFVQSVCISTLTALSVSNRSRLLSDVPIDVLKRHIISFADFNSTQQFGKTHPGFYRMVDDHLGSITARNYREALHILNLTVDEFTSNFPAFQVPEVGQEAILPTGMARAARHKILGESPHIMFGSLKFCVPKSEHLLIFELRDMTDLSRHCKKYLVFRLESGTLSSCQLAGYLSKSREMYALCGKQDHRLMIRLMKSVFNDDVFTIHDYYHLTSIRNRKWWKSTLGYHLQQHKRLLIPWEALLVCVGSLICKIFGVSFPSLRLFQVVVAFNVGYFANVGSKLFQNLM